MHVTLGHTTVMAEAQYFGLPDNSSHSPAAALALTISRISQLALNVTTLLANMILHRNLCNLGFLRMPLIAC